MPKNIIIYSDGTGQRGGQLFDEKRSNIYKLFRATRCAPDSTIDPALQVTYYDPGLGTLPETGSTLYLVLRKIHNVVSQATGLGITANIIDCYAAIIKLWEPGDRIFLFGFSRGAYTVRCLAAVLAFCGVPTTLKDGSALVRDDASLRKLARYGVTRVYQHVSSPRDEKYIGQRQSIAKRFREQHHSANDDDSNAYPYFIGVFETVASIASYQAQAITFFIAVGVWLAVSAVLSHYLGTFRWWLGGLAIVGVLLTIGAYLWTHVKFAVGLKDFSFWKTLHLTEVKMKFYDRHLNDNVGYARHAIAIDEHRKAFDRVEWGQRGDWRDTGPGNPSWFKQLWFAGCHADIGGGYSENESRLSDITLQWMLEEASAVPNGVVFDTEVLHTFPSPTGMQHDETKTFPFKYSAKIDRFIAKTSTLHHSVADRFAAVDVLQYDKNKPYRPVGLQSHETLLAYYSSPTPTTTATI